MKIAVIDIETTGRSPSVGTIVEVGACLLDLETHFTSKLLDLVVIQPQFETLHEAGRVDDSWVFQNSDLTVDMVRNGVSWDQAAIKIQRILDKFPCTAYNKAFDFGFFRASGLRVPRELPCPMIAATPVLKLPGRYDDYKWPSVDEAWHYFFPDRSSFVEAHRAYDDAVHEALIVQKLFTLGAWKPIIER